MAIILEVTYGRYTAACTWFEMITGQNVVGNPYAPETIDPQVVKIAQNAAHYAVQKPDEVTDLVDFKQPELSDTELKAPSILISARLHSLPPRGII